MSGLIWYVMPMSLITINDIGAYMVGFFGGKTPLIKLSPKKTREGFIGGGIITMVLGTILTHYLIQVTRSYFRLIIWSDYPVTSGASGQQTERADCNYLKNLHFWKNKDKSVGL
jgi:CDP-diglyceride synthetase